ncbi:MAG: sugar transferase [Treponema sp.]|nr:sugar transferase [Treponema sp.]
MYKLYFKRVLDLLIAICAILILSPIFLFLIVIGTIKMKGNPFFIQMRPGKEEKLFRIIKFRTMTNEKDVNGELLPDNNRLIPYGRFLRSTSLDELPELFNILKGDMSLVGPRPLSKKYIPFYTIKEHHRHDVLPGLTGLAQVNGRNSLTWEEKFEYDLQYIQSISFKNDLRIIYLTIKKVLIRDGIGQGEEAPISLHIIRKDMGK